MNIDEQLAAACRRLRSIRRSREMTQIELAQMAGITHPHVSCIERGRNGGTLRTWLRLAKALDIPLVELLGDAYAPNERFTI